ncbi:MAG: lipopolysaccharide assembly protein LapB [Pseudohongiellaceae bacterium]
MQGDVANNLTVLLLVLVAVIAAWLLGRRSRGGSFRTGRHELSRDYFIGLNYLLNDEPDDAIDTFINALEINSNTLETHMALGTLLRRRGKVDKSIVVYQSILARPRLHENEINRVKVELIRSYISAGLLDRAERLLTELDSAGADVRRKALSLGVILYQQEKDWENAVAAAMELIRLCPARERSRYQSMASHFCCELAELAVDQKQYNNARQRLKKAFQYNRNNVRASMLAGHLEMLQGNYREAIKEFLKVKQQDADFESETFVQLLECYHASGMEKQLKKFIQQSLEGTPPASVLLGISHYIESQSGSREALQFLLNFLREKPSLKLLNGALDFMSREEGGEIQQNLLLFHNIIAEYVGNRAMYQCRNCGFEGKSLHWLCPGCSEWGSIKPIKGPIGE